MPLDAICLRAVTNELNNVLAGCRVEKVYQPDRDEIVLQTRGGQGGPRRLLLSIAAGSPRVHFIDAARENPAAPPMFCMLLRKHVQGAKIAAVSQPAVERMLTIELDTTGCTLQKAPHLRADGQALQRHPVRRGQPHY